VREFAPVSHRLPPTGTDSRRRRGGYALPRVSHTPPPPPKGLSAWERAAWRGLWSSPVSALWTSDDVLADDPRRAGSGRNGSRPPSARERERLLSG